MNDDWDDEVKRPEHVPPIEDRIWAHPSEYKGPDERRSHRMTGLLGVAGLIILGVIGAHALWPPISGGSQHPKASPSSLAIGESTSNHINSLARSLVAISASANSKSTVYGLAISPSGYIIVPANALPLSKQYFVKVTGKPELPATLVATDPSADTSVLKVATQLPNFISDSSGSVAKAGQMTIGIGPSGTATKPMLVISQIKQTGMSQILPGGQAAQDSYLADAAASLNPEGLLFVDNHGNPLGLGIFQLKNSWIISPLATMIRAAERIELADGMPRGWLGIVGVSSDPSNTSASPPTSKEGVYVYSVSPKSPAQIAGIEPQDEITAIDNIPVKNISQLQTMLSQYPSGTKVMVTLIRHGQTIHIKSTLGVKSDG